MHFSSYKDAITSAKLMRNPDISQMLILQTDASNMGVGAVLSQGIREDRQIAYLSRKLLPKEQKYSVVEQKCLVVVLGLKPLKHICWGSSL